MTTGLDKDPPPTNNSRAQTRSFKANKRSQNNNLAFTLEARLYIRRAITMKSTHCETSRKVFPVASLSYPILPLQYIFTRQASERPPKPILIFLRATLQATSKHRTSHLLSSLQKQSLPKSRNFPFPVFFGPWPSLCSGISLIHRATGYHRCGTRSSLGTPERQ
jgi:hypothetical protein